MRRAGDDERRALGELFAELCAIESPFGSERAVADRVIAELRGLGIEVEEDDAGRSVGSTAGNLLARIPAATAASSPDAADAAALLGADPALAGPGAEPAQADAAALFGGMPVEAGSAEAESPASAPGGAGLTEAGRAGDPPSILLCAHLDTVPLTGPVEPVLEDGVWSNRHEAILGADNKAALAVMLAVARRAVAEPPPVGIELLFTVCEENALAGAKAFDASRLRSRFGYVFDHATPIGEVIVAAPTYHRIVADVRGLAAHAGLHPERGRSAIVAAARAIAAMPLGRLDAETTANVGMIDGGSGVNVVPEQCTIVGEARSLDDDKVEAVVSEIVDHLQDGANAAECDVDVTVEVLFHGFRVRPSAPELVAAESALLACGYTPRRIATGGGSDANALIRQGFPCLNLANGTERAHQPDERVSVDALEGMLDVALALVSESAEVLS